MIDTDYPINGIYIGSDRKWRDNWIEWREAGYELAASWLDDPNVSMERCLYEAAASRLSIFFRAEGDPVPYELGAAFAAKRHMIVVGDFEELKHPNVYHLELEDAMQEAHGLIHDFRHRMVAEIQTLAYVEYQRNSHRSIPEEADLIKISAHKAESNSAIILPYPQGLDFAEKICHHISAGITKGYEIGKREKEAAA